MGAKFSALVQTGPRAHPASCTKGTGSFPGVKSGRGVALTPHPLLVPWPKKSRAIPLLPLWVVQPVQSLSACTTVHFTFTYTSTPPMDRTACTEPQCLYKGALYLYLTAELYLYSPYGPYCLHRVSVPVQGCTLPYFIQCIKFVMSICPNFFQALSQIAHALKQATPIQLHLSHFNTH